MSERVFVCTTSTCEPNDLWRSRSLLSSCARLRIRLHLYVFPPWRPVLIWFWYFHPAVSSTHSAPCLHPQRADINVFGSPQEPPEVHVTPGSHWLHVGYAYLQQPLPVTYHRFECRCKNLQSLAHVCSTSTYNFPPLH